MIIEDVVNCDGCGAVITHILTAAMHPPSRESDPSYYLCADCDDESVEEDHLTRG